MNDALKTLESLLQNAAAGPQPFPATSRYHGLTVLTYVNANGQTVAYLSRRIVPPPDRFATVQTYTVKDGDRLDNLSAKDIGDPQQWWRLADANGATRPNELVETPGRRLRITLGEGIPVSADD